MQIKQKLMSNWVKQGLEPHHVRCIMTPQWHSDLVAGNGNSLPDGQLCNVAEGLLSASTTGQLNVSRLLILLLQVHDRRTGITLTAAVCWARHDLACLVVHALSS